VVGSKVRGPTQVLHRRTRPSHPTRAVPHDPRRRGHAAPRARTDLVRVGEALHGGRTKKRATTRAAGPSATATGTGARGAGADNKWRVGLGPNPSGLVPDEARVFVRLEARQASKPHEATIYGQAKALKQRPRSVQLERSPIVPCFVR
jgi:hypothetical protein